MNNLVLGAFILMGLVGVFLCVLGTVLLIKLINRINKTNAQLLLAVVGKTDKPEPTLRALIASEKSPKKTILGIAPGKKDKGKKPLNTDFALTVGENRGV